MESVPTWVVGRNDLSRLGLKSYLKSSSFEVVGEAASFMEAVRQVDRENPPELLLLNLGPGSVDEIARLQHGMLPDRRQTDQTPDPKHSRADASTRALVFT